MDDSSRPSSRRRLVILVAGVMLLAAVVSGMALYRSGDRNSDENPTTAPTVGWGGSEGHPSCVYHPRRQTVEAKLKIEGNESGYDEVTVTVTAYADENTSKPVGSTSRVVGVGAHEEKLIVVTIPVEKAPHVDIDRETACKLSVEY